MSFVPACKDGFLFSLLISRISMYQFGPLVFDDGKGHASLKLQINIRHSSGEVPGLWHLEYKIHILLTECMLDLYWQKVRNLKIKTTVSWCLQLGSINTIFIPQIFSIHTTEVYFFTSNMKSLCRKIAAYPEEFKIYFYLNTNVCAS